MKKITIEEVILGIEAALEGTAGYLQTGKDYVNLNIENPEGEDMFFEIEKTATLEDLIDMVSAYDADESIEMWLEAKRGNTKGIPSVRRLIKNCDYIEKATREIACKLEVITTTDNEEAQLKQFEELADSLSEISVYLEKDEDQYTLSFTTDQYQDEDIEFYAENIDDLESQIDNLCNDYDSEEDLEEILDRTGFEINATELRRLDRHLRYKEEKLKLIWAKLNY